MTDKFSQGKVIQLETYEIYDLLEKKANSYHMLLLRFAILLFYLR